MAGKDDVSSVFLDNANASYDKAAKRFLSAKIYPTGRISEDF